MFTYILTHVGILGGIGIALGAGLGYFGKKFAVKEDPRVLAIRDALPGVNCAACGYTGCDGFANGVASGQAKVTGCPVGGEDLARALADIMGVKADKTVKLTAYVNCCGNGDVAKRNYLYEGIGDCNAISLMPGQGQKSCIYSCIGEGSCALGCPFGAIDMVNTIAVVNPEKCTACTLCVITCPKALIELVPKDSTIRVECHSNDIGKLVRQNCRVGCIGCGICVKNCPHDAIIAEKNLARIDYNKCTLCGICVEKCPTKVIKNLGGVA